MITEDELTGNFRFWYADWVIKSLFSFVLIVLLFVASLGLVAYRLQDPAFVVGQARQVNLYGRLAENVSALLPIDQTKGFALTSADVSDVLKSGIDGEQFYGFLTAAGNAYLPWLTGKTKDLNFSYDLTGTKQKLSDAATTKILVVAASLSFCLVPVKS